MADMEGFATSKEIQDLFFKLKVIKDKKELENPFCLFVCGKGFLNGYETLEYLENEYFKE